MRTVRDAGTLSTIVKDYRTDRLTIGFVPTMGALHEGHLSLVRLARAKADRVIVSIFVNPAQFGPNEDYLRYPRNEGRDLQLLERAGVDAAYLPEVSAMYPSGHAISVDPGPVGQMYEGQVRPGHFSGVLTVVAKLFHQVNPHFAIFGQKDAQQLFLIKRMVRDLDFLVDIIDGPTMREPDGLAMSSRNVYLKAAERNRAHVLHQALRSAETALGTGVRSLPQLKEAMLDSIANAGDVTVDYLTVVSEESFLEVDPVPDSARIIGAIRLGPVRLIDNIPVEPK